VHFSTYAPFEAVWWRKFLADRLCWLGLGLRGRGRNIEILLVFGIWNLELELELDLRDGSCVSGVALVRVCRFEEPGVGKEVAFDLDEMFGGMKSSRVIVLGVSDNGMRRR